MNSFMQSAIDEAKQGLSEGGIPIGSVLVHNGRILGSEVDAKLTDVFKKLNGK